PTSHRPFTTRHPPDPTRPSFPTRRPSDLTRSAELPRQQAARRQRIIADHLRIEAETRPARQQAIVPVLLLLLRCQDCRRRRRRKIGRATSELQSLRHLVCRLLLEKKKKKI